MRAPSIRFALQPVLFLVLVLSGCGEGGEEITGTEESDNPCTSLPAIAMGESKTGSLGADDCLLSARGRVDRWAFNIPADTWIQVDLSSDLFDPVLSLETAAGALVAENDDWGSLNSRITRELPAGDYVLVAASYGGSGSGAYRLQVREALDCADVGALASGTATTGSLPSGSCPMPWGASAQYWGLEIAEESRLRLELESDDFDEILLLVHPEFGFVSGADWNHPSGHARLDMTLEPGSWRVAVTGAEPGEIGSYALSVAPVPPCGGAAVVLGEALEGTLTVDDCMLLGGLVSDSLHLTVTEATDLLLEAKSPEILPLILHVVDQDGDFYAWADSWESAGTARVREIFQPGEYSIFVAGEPMGTLGDYVFTATPVVCEPSGEVAFGESVSGRLDSADCRRENGAYREEWTLVLTEETAVRMEMTSSELDSYLEVVDAEGAVVASDDDSAGNRNARVDTTLAAGTYGVRASSFGPGVEGAYTLSVGAPPSAGASVSALEPTLPKSAASPSLLEAPPPSLERQRGAAWDFIRLLAGKRSGRAR